MNISHTRQAHVIRMAKRKADRDRRPEPPMTRKRAMTFLEAWSSSEYVKRRGVGSASARRYHQSLVYKPKEG